MPKFDVKKGGHYSGCNVDRCALFLCRCRCHISSVEQIRQDEIDRELYWAEKSEPFWGIQELNRQKKEIIKKLKEKK